MNENNIEVLENELSEFKGQWFVINCNSGSELKVRNDLLQKIESSNLKNEIFDIRVSQKSVMGKDKKVTTKNKFPGYIFINMLMTDDTWFVIRNTPGVTGFIGSSGKGAKPLPLTIEEVAQMLHIEDEKEQVEKNVKSQNNPTTKKEKVLFTAEFKVGDAVVIQSGAFEGKESEVIEMDYEKGTAVVNIEMFGRVTKAEIEFDNAKLAYTD